MTEFLYPNISATGPEGVEKFQVWDTVLSQYANSEIITTLITEYADYLDQTKNLDRFFKNIWNIETARDEGLDIWGRIVGVSRYINVPADTPNPGYLPFVPGPYTMDDTQYRTVILVKALANIVNSTSAGMNVLLQILFKNRGRCYVIDLGQMAMRYVFEFYLQPYEYVTIMNIQIAPRPAGVLTNILQVDPSTTFGFNEGIQFQPFNQGVFFNGG